MGADQSRPAGFEFLDSGRLPPRCAAASPMDTHRSAVSSAAQQRFRAIERNSGSNASGLYACSSSEDFHAPGGVSRADVLEQRQDERRLLLLFECMKLCESAASAVLPTSPTTPSTSNVVVSGESRSFEHDAVLWSVFALLRSCRGCGAFCPSFSHATLCGSQPALALLCDDCQANGLAECVNATADSVAAAVARVPGFHGCAVTGTWQLPIVNLALERMQSPGTNAAALTTHHHHPQGSAHPLQQSAAHSSHLSVPRSSSGVTGTGGNASSATSSSRVTHEASTSVRYLLNALLSGLGPVAVVQGVSGTAVETCMFGSVLPGLESVHVSTTCNQRESDLEHVRRLFRDRPHLRLAFEGRSFDDKSLMFLGSAPFRHRVTHLNLQHCDRITSAGFKLIATCFPALQRVNLRGSSNIDLNVFQEPITPDSANVLDLLVAPVAGTAIASSHQQQQLQQQGRPQSVAILPIGSDAEDSSRDNSSSTGGTVCGPAWNALCNSLESLDFSACALQFEGRVGVLGRLQRLRKLNLSGCDKIEDAAVVDMCRIATWSALVACALLPAEDDPLRDDVRQKQPHNAEDAVERFRRHVRAATDAAWNPARSTTVLGAWLTSLDLSDLRQVSDISLRWLCASWAGADDYLRVLQFAATGFTPLLSANASATSAAPFCTAVAAHAEKTCLIVPRDVAPTSRGDGMGASHNTSFFTPTQRESPAHRSFGGDSPATPRSAVAVGGDVTAGGAQFRSPTATPHLRSTPAPTTTFEKVSRLLCADRALGAAWTRPPVSWLAPSLSRLSVANCGGLSEDGLALAVCSFPRLTALDMTSTTCSDRVLAAVVPEMLPLLRELRVGRCRVSCGAVCALLRRMPSVADIAVSPFVTSESTAEESGGVDAGNVGQPTAVAASAPATTAAEVLRNASALRDASFGSVRTLALHDPALALAAVKLLAVRGRSGTEGNTAPALSPTPSSSSSDSSQGALRVVVVPSVLKLADIESVLQLTKNLSEGRHIPADALARCAVAAVHSYLRAATHQPDRDIVFQHLL